MGKNIYVASPIDGISPLHRELLAKRVRYLLDEWFDSSDSIYFPLESYDIAKNIIPGRVRRHVLDRLRSSDLLVAFQPQHSGGVCYELGFAAALGIETRIYRFADMDDGARLTLMVGETDIIEDK